MFVPLRWCCEQSSSSVVDSNIYSSFIPQVQVKTGQVCDSGLATVDFIEENVNVGGHADWKLTRYNSSKAH